MPSYDYKCDSCGVIEISHGMTEPDKTECPHCGSGLQKMISAGAAIIIGGREANQYKDIKAAKYWRDKNGVRHPVTAADGYSTSATVNRQTATPEEAAKRKKADREKSKQKRLALQKAKADAWNKKYCK